MDRLEQIKDTLQFLGSGLMRADEIKPDIQWLVHEIEWLRRKLEPKIPDLIYRFESDHSDITNKINEIIAYLKAKEDI